MPETIEGNVTVNLSDGTPAPVDSGVTVEELEDLKKQIADLQQQLAIANHTVKVQGENLTRVQNDASNLRVMASEFQQHVFVLCKALGKTMAP